MEAWHCVHETNIKARLTGSRMSEYYYFTCDTQNQLRQNGQKFDEESSVSGKDCHMQPEWTGFMLKKLHKFSTEQGYKEDFR